MLGKKPLKEQYHHCVSIDGYTELPIEHYLPEPF
jgi:hypothetical protein